ETFSKNLFHDGFKTVTVIAEAFIETEALFVEIAKHMEWFNANVGPFDTALQETPEVFNAIGVNHSINISFGVPHEGMSEAFGTKSLIGSVFIGIDRRSRLNRFPNNLAHFITPRFRNHASLNFASPVFISFKKTKDRSFARASSPPMKFCFSFRLVHVASEATDIGFINFNFTAEGLDNITLHRKSDAVKHEPCGFLRDADVTMNLIRANTILAIGNHPHCKNPFIQRDWRIFKNCPGFNRKLPLGVSRLALKLLTRCNECRILTTTHGTGWLPIWPVNRSKIFNAVHGIGEVFNRVFQCFWCLHDERVSDG